MVAGCHETGTVCMTQYSYPGNSPPVI